MNNYREYEAPIPVSWFDPAVHGYGRGMAIGVKDTELPNGKLKIDFLVQPTEGEPFMIWQKHILETR